MGADLLLTAARWPKGEGGELMAEAQLREALLAAIPGLGEDALREVVKERHFCEPEDIPEEFEPEGWQEWARNALRQSVAGIFVLDANGNVWTARDVTSLILDGEWWLFAGGTSYGESFEGMEALENLLNAGLLDDGTTNAMKLIVPSGDLSTPDENRHPLEP